MSSDAFPPMRELPADHDDPLDFGGGEPRVAQHAADHGQAAGGERRSGRVKIRKFDVKMNASA